MRWLRSRLAGLVSSRSAADDVGTPRILDSYCQQAPAAQNAVDIFAGEWTSRFPVPLDSLSAGHALLFADPRVSWALEQLPDPGVRGARVLELGPLEAGHTYMLDRAGAGEVLAIESNTRAFLKCLIAKELLGMPSARFVCGDFRAYLRTATERFDLVIASGVLYHMIDPVDLLARIARLTDTIFIWTHYYDREVLGARPDAARRVVQSTPASVDGFDHALHRHEYQTALNQPGFCGGSRPFAHWLTRADILGALQHFGMTELAIGHEQRDHPNGPAFAVLARRPPR